MKLQVNDIFNKELPADAVTNNSRRQVEHACFSFVTPKQTAHPEMLHVSPEMLEQLGLSEADSKRPNCSNISGDT